MRILVLTDNRFWRSSMGSQARVKALLEHLAVRASHLQIAFIGGPTETDLEAVEAWRSAQRRAIDLTFSGEVQGGPTVPAAKSTTSGLATRMRSAAAKRLRHARYLWRLRRLPVLAHDLLPSRPSWNYRLAIDEPSLEESRREQSFMWLRTWAAGLPTDSRPDVVLVEYVRLTYLLDALPPALRDAAHLVVDTHDVQHERRLRFHAAGIAHDLKIEAREEAACLGRFHTILAIQEIDAKKFVRLLDGRRTSPMEQRPQVLVVGHPVAAAADTVGLNRPTLGGPVKVLFVGSDMAPNAVAAQRLLHGIWPAIPASIAPRLQLTLAGSMCKALANESCPSNVEVRGWVTDFQALLAEHQICASPIDFGGGLKIKNVEALSAGLALVTTRCGAEGLEEGLLGPDGQSAFRVADDDASFADWLSTWATDPDRLHAQRLRGLEFARARFGPAEAFGALDEWLDRVIGNRPSTDCPPNCALVAPGMGQTTLEDSETENPCWPR